MKPLDFSALFSTTNSPSKRSDVLNSLVTTMLRQKRFNEAIVLVQELRKKDPENLQLLIRTSPAEDGKRFQKLKVELPEINPIFPSSVS